LFDHNNKVVGLLGVSFDITERKQHEQQLEKMQAELTRLSTSKQKFISEMVYLSNLIAILPGNVYWKGLDGRYLGCNDNTAAVSGLSNRHEFVGKKAGDLFSEELASLVERVDQRVIEEDREICLEEPGVDGHGNPATYITRKIPLHDENNAVVGMLGVSFDISERKTMEQALHDAKEHAEAANKAKSDFMLNMSHDIRTPFSGVLGFADMLYSGESDPVKKQQLGHIIDASHEILGVLNEVIDLVTVEEGGMPLRDIKLNLYDVLRGLNKMFAAAIDNKKLKLIIESDPQIPTQLICDKHRLHRVLINLMSNAVKFTDTGQIKLSAALVENRNEQAVIKITVADTGIGIPQNKFDAIFEKFNRLSASYSSAYKGAGIGLYLVKKFITDMHGDVQVSSTVGQGSQFSVTIPMRVAD